jgi:hypothetical protein
LAINDESDSDPQPGSDVDRHIPCSRLSKTACH